MSNKITFPIGYYPNPLSSRSLSGGQLYIGQPDTDPEIEINRKDVTALQEDGSQVVISQPIEMSAGGVPIYNGSPVSLFVSGDYSTKVLGVRGAQAYYIPNSHVGNASEVRVFSNVEEMSGSLLSVGSTYSTQGYYTTGVGGATYLIVDGDSSDPYVNISVNGGAATAILQTDGYINALQAGLKSDNYTDNSEVLQYLFDLGGKIFIPVGDYRHETTLYITENGTEVQGATRGGTIIRSIGVSGIQYTGPNLQDVSLGNVTLIGDYSTSNAIGLKLDRVVRGSSFSDIFVRGYGLEGDYGAGVYVGKGDGTLGTWSFKLDSITVEDCARGFVIIESQNITLVSCVSRLNLGDSLYARDWITGAIEGGTFENSDSTRTANSIAISMQDCRNISVDGIYTENSVDETIKLSNCRAIFFGGCRLNGYTSVAVSDTHKIINLVSETQACSFTACTLSALSSVNQNAIYCSSDTKFNSFRDINITVPVDYVTATVVDDHGFNNKFSNVFRNGTTTLYTGARYQEFTPTISFETNGDFSPSITSLDGRLRYLTDNAVFIEMSLRFTTNAYTTATGQFIIDGLPVVPEEFDSLVAKPLNLVFFGYDFSGFGFQAINAVIKENESQVRLVGTTATVYSYFSQSHIKPSQEYSFMISGVISI